MLLQVYFAMPYLHHTRWEYLMDGIGKQIRENEHEWKRQRKAKWAKDHPKITNATTGWGKAFKKEGKALGGTLSKETKKLFGL